MHLVARQLSVFILPAEDVGVAVDDRKRVRGPREEAGAADSRQGGAERQCLLREPDGGQSYSFNGGRDGLLGHDEGSWVHFCGVGG